MKRFPILLLLFVLFSFSSCIEDLENILGKKDVTKTGEVANITPTSADITCYAYLENLETAFTSDDKIGVVVGLDSQPTTQNATVINSDGIENNKYLVQVHDLLPDTTYYYRSYVFSVGLYKFGETKSFRTKAVGDSDIITCRVEDDDIAYPSVILRGKYNATSLGLVGEYNTGFLVSDDADNLHKKGKYLEGSNEKDGISVDYEIDTFDPQFFCICIKYGSNGMLFGNTMAFSFGEKGVLTVDADSIFVDKNGGKNILKVVSSEAWKANVLSLDGTDTSWVTVTTEGNGQAGLSKLYVAATKNKDKERTAVIEISNSKESVSVIVAQNGDPTMSIPYTSAALNDFTVQTITGIDWSLGSSYAKASGYANNYTSATKTWLISPAINADVNGADGLHVSFDNVLRYVKSSTNLKGWHKVLASKDYMGNVTTATWTDLGFQPVESTTQTWDFYAATPVNLPADFVGEEKVYIAFYFECDGSNSTTWELKNFVVSEGTVVVPPTPPTPVDAETVTIAEFNAKPVSTDKWYSLTGTVGTLKDGDVYGNFDLTDATGSVYVYGLLAEKDGSTRLFQELIAATGLAEGDKINIIGQRGDYNGKVEVLNAFFVEIVEKGHGGGNGNTDECQGDGTESDPYNVAAVRATGSPATMAWVKGYIVGTVKDGSKSYDDAVFGTADASNINIIIADAANCTDPSKAIPVQLPAGAIRDALSLQQHPDNYKKQILLYGSLEKYFGQPGIKNVSQYSIDGIGGGEGGGTTTSDFKVGSTIDFTTGDGGFVAYDITLGTLSYVWAQSASYGFKASAYKTGNVAAESWLVSPVLDLTDASAAKMVINHACNYLSGAACTDFLSVWASADFNGDVSAATWTKLTVPIWPSGSDWNFVDSGDIYLSAVCGKKVVIGFCYTSTEAIAPTWEIRYVQIK